MENYFIYARVSSKEQEAEGYSIPAQVKFLREFAVKQSFTIAHEYIEAESAKEEGRPEFTAMCEALKTSDVTGILVEKIDRLSRNFADYVTVDALVRKQNKVIHFARSNMVYDKDTSPALLFAQDINFAFARFYVLDLSQNVTKGMRQKASTGVYPSRPPMGYLNRDKGIVVDEDRAPLVKRLFVEYANTDWSLERLRQEAHSWGLRNGAGRPLHKTSVIDTLRNPFYYGIFRWDGNEIQGTHETLIDKDLFDRVQDKMDGRMRPVRTKHSFPLRGLLRCGECGSPITAETHKGFIYYRCTKRRGPCSQPYIRQEALLEEFARVLAGFQKDEEYVGLVMEGCAALSKRDLDESETIRKNLARRQSTIATMLDNLVDKYVNGDIPDEIYKTKLAALQAEEKDITARLKTAAGNKWPAFELVEKVGKIALICGDAFRLSDWELKGRFLNLVGSNWILRDKKIVSFQLNEPFNILFRALDTASVGSGGPGATSFELLHSINEARIDVVTLDEILTVCGHTA